MSDSLSLLHILRAIGVTAGLLAILGGGAAIWLRGPLILTTPPSVPEVPISEQNLRRTVQFLSVEVGS